jgi:flagellar basal-body rod modification protein FlgD
MTSTSSATSGTAYYESLINGTASTGSSSSSSTSSSSAASQVTTAYNTFITLLTSQLQHQDPLNPTNTDTFTQELIQLSGVEQQLTTNTTLSAMNTDLSTITQANGLGYVGKTVTASGSTAPLQSGSAQWDYTLNSAAQTVTLNVKDSNGNTVYTTSGDTTSGQHSFSWNGTSTSGTTVSSGDYTLSVTATDTSGNTVSTTTSMVGTVTGVDTSSGTTELQVGDIQVPIANVTAIN